MIDPDYGLFDELPGLDVLTEDDCERISCEKTINDRNSQLLAYLAAGTEDQNQNFMRALWYNSQSHVYNFINENGSMLNNFFAEIASYSFIFYSVNFYARFRLL
jgi:hypothetical protein